MKFFGIDTTRKIAKIFLYDSEEDKRYTLTMGDGVKHSEGLFLYIEKALFENKMDIKDFDYYACVIGPGSFTGIRVGMSTIKGFNQVAKKTVVPINTFEIFASKYKSGVVLLNSTNTSCYYAKIKGREIIDAGVVDKANIKDMLDKETVYILAEEQNIIQLEYDNIEVVDTLDDLYIDAVLKKIENNEATEFVPYYLQLSQAERNLKND
ncbi:MAG: tRNA (adenosine(37)-N6)-threonylcarbamoyltransferase complex dimerization subunit type 1 TsaB [Clostridiales bacterium]|nr:tRNA (adenosine(37)-N6)-threonylcarbamoyltransferase complex dimerization subunit type 1 TsaB [Clostridiales bacterium]